MTIERTLTALPLVALWAAIACAPRRPAPDPSPPSGPCGSLYQLRSTDRAIPRLNGGDSWYVPIANQHNARVDLSYIALAAERYCVERGGYPASLRALIRDGRHRSTYDACTLQSSPGHDPWGESYRYELRAGIPYIYSSGPDRRPGTADDVTIVGPASDLVPISVHETCRFCAPDQGENTKPRRRWPVSGGGPFRVGRRRQGWRSSQSRAGRSSSRRGAPSPRLPPHVSNVRISGNP